MAGGAQLAAGTALVEARTDLDELAARHHVSLAGLASRPAVPTSRLRAVRVGLVKPWLPSMDEGWTRFVLERHGFDVTALDNKTIMAGDLAKRVDVVLIPSIEKEILVEGRYHREQGQMDYFAELPPAYSGGFGKEGTAEIVRFVEQGGTLVALSEACDFVLESFNIPVRNVLAKTKDADFAVAGALLRIHLDPSHPIAYGMPAQAAAFVSDRVAFETTPPGAELTRAVVAWYPDDRRDVLLSGWLEGGERLERRAAIVALTYGRGKIALLGFRVQQRAQMEGTFKLLFGALRWAGMD